MAIAAGPAGVAAGKGRAVAVGLSDAGAVGLGDAVEDGVGLEVGEEVMVGEAVGAVLANGTAVMVGV